MSDFFTEFWSDFSRPENIVGHIAYVLLIVSMMMRSMNWLRFFAILAGGVSSIYYAILSDYVSMFWEALFSLVNLGQLIILKIENRSGRFSDEEALFFKTCLGGVEKAHARRLMKLGAWTEVQEDITLITQGEKPKKLKFLVSGEARIERDGRVIGTSGRGDFIGEMSYLSGQTATATVITTERTRFLAFEHESLREFLKKNTDVRHALEASFNRDLVGKLSSRKENRGEEANEAGDSEDE